MSTPRPPSAASGRMAVAAAGLLLVALSAAAAAAWATGAVDASLLSDAGPLVRWGLPLVTVVSDLAAALTIGLLVLAATALPTTAGRPRPLAYPPALRCATFASATWAVATVVLTVLTYSDLAGRPLGDPGFGSELAYFVRSLDLGRGLGVTALVAAAVATASAAAITVRAAGLLTLLSFVALVPAALAGHAAGTSSHETAVTGLGLHLLGVTVWVGGLAGLALLRRGLGTALAPAAARYSVLAAWCFVAVAVSGLVSAAIRVGTVAGLATAYGGVVVAKAVALLALGVVGWRHRRRSLPALTRGEPTAFARLAGVELGIMAVAVGLAAALARSAPPIPAAPPTDVSRAEAITGYPLPPAPSASHWLSVWQPDLLWVVVAALAAGLYGVGVRRLARRGDAWPVLRTVSWAIGVAVLVYVTCGPPMAYGRVLFSAHMVGHMTLSMVVPPLLVLGAPLTLALRVLPSRRDGSRGPREWLLAVTASRLLAVLSHPVVAAAVFAFGLILFYYSGLFGLALTTHVGHELMHVHFLLAGYLFAWVLIGVDPGPHRTSHPMRLVLLLATMGFHAFFGISLIMGSRVLQPQFFEELGRTWGRSPLADQQFGGGLAWGIGEFPTLLLAIVIAVQWSRSDDREARRRDRAADRDGDAELMAYNAMLGRLAEVDRSASAGTPSGRPASDTAAGDGVPQSGSHAPTSAP